MKKVTLKFLKHATQFRLAYHVGETGVFEEKQANELVSAGVAVAVADEELPEDLPGRNHIKKAGLTLEDLKLIEDLTEIKGITGALAEKINEYLNKE